MEKGVFMKQYKIVYVNLKRKQNIYKMNNILKIILIELCIKLLNSIQINTFYEFGTESNHDFLPIIAILTAFFWSKRHI